jgi:hypothetical protein
MKLIEPFLFMLGCLVIVTLVIAIGITAAWVVKKLGLD